MQKLDFFISFEVGFRFDTILKSLVLNFLRSSDCINISLLTDKMF